MRKILARLAAAVLSLALADPSLAAQPYVTKFAGSDKVFLTGGRGQFVVGNAIKSSNNFLTAGGFWPAAHSTAAAPTITTVSDTLPDGTTGNVSSVVFGATTTGTTQYSVIGEADTTDLSQYPITFGVWAKVTAGTGTLFTTLSVVGSTTHYKNASITNDGQWHLVKAIWLGQSEVGGSAANLQLNIGINQLDPGQRTVTASTTIELTGAYLVATQSDPLLTYADVKAGGDLEVTGTPPTTATITRPYPDHTGIRDPSQWSLYAPSPISLGKPAEVWAAGGMGDPVVQSQFQSGGLYWAFTAQCYANTAGQLYISQCLESSPDGLNWTEDTTNAPYLQVSGGILANPTVSSAGSGFTAGTGTATWTGGGCTVNPVLAVTVAGTTISGVTPSPNNGVGTGACTTWPTGSGTTWSYTGVGSGSGASFTFAQVIGTEAAPGPAKYILHPHFLPYGCSDGTNPHNFCVIYSGSDTAGTGHLYLAWSDTIDGVYNTVPCTTGTGSCSTAAPVTIQNLPVAGYSSPGVPTVVNVGGSTGTNYIYTYVGGNALAGLHYAIYTTSADKTNTASGNTLFFQHDMGFTITTAVDWYAPVAGTSLLDEGIFLNHCGFYEFYFTFENTSVPNPPWFAGAPSNTQLVGEAVSASPLGPWFQYPHPAITTNSGDPGPLELNGRFSLTSAYQAFPSNTAGGFALTGPQGACP